MQEKARIQAMMGEDLLFLTDEQELVAELEAAGVTFVEVDQQAFADAARDAVIGAVDADIRPLAEQIFNN